MATICGFNNFNTFINVNVILNLKKNEIWFISPQRVGDMTHRVGRFDHIL